MAVPGLLRGIFKQKMLLAYPCKLVINFVDSANGYDNLSSVDRVISGVF